MIFEINNKKWQIDDKIIQINIYLQTFLGAQIIWFLAKLYRQILCFSDKIKKTNLSVKYLNFLTFGYKTSFPLSKYTQVICYKLVLVFLTKNWIWKKYFIFL